MRNPRVVQVSKPVAKKMTKEVIAHYKSMETAWFELGRLIEDCFKKHVPAALGMNAKDWMEKCIPGSVSKGFRALRITKALSGIPQEAKKQITEGNAFALTKLPEKERKSDKWVKKAIETPNKEFQAEIDEHREKRFGIKREEFVTLRLSMPRAIYDKFEAAIQKLARALSIDLLGNEGRRIMVYERMADVIDQVSEEALKNMTEGQ